VKLSATQLDALYHLRELGAMTEFQAAWLVGRSRNVTMRSLERLGLVRWFPTPEHWKLTKEGRLDLSRRDRTEVLGDFNKETTRP
jgi:hypothetical protein